mmetsp:Transcript_58922/g.167701  ORF Transcript_58922/g.167701 Transcript_58922/m.167701 type:complete len:237 (-) Transcript_58922:124-834(-)
MFPGGDPWADFADFFSDAAAGGASEEDAAEQEMAIKELEEALVQFYRDVGQPEKAKPDEVRRTLEMKKWRGSEYKMYDALHRKYQQREHRAALPRVKQACDKLKNLHSRGGSFGGFGDSGGGFGGFDFKKMSGMGGGFGDMFGDMGGFGGKGGGASMSFSSMSFSSSSGGKTVYKESRTETVGGKRVTKSIATETDSDGRTRATVEMERDGKKKRMVRDKKAGALGQGQREPDGDL